MDRKEEMNIKILKSSVDGTTNNKGGCAALAEYINHEDEERIQEGKQPLPYTTPNGVEVTTEEVIQKIDRNHTHLGKNDDKFYALVISPSENEIKAMGTTEEEIYRNSLNLIKAISDSYAENFNRSNIIDSENLVMYWKPHFTRGDNGDWQFHIHGIVSRNGKGVDGKAVKLSPLTNHSHTEDGVIKGGFDRKVFFERCEKIFDKLLKYERHVAETFEYCNAQRHGSPEEKAEQTVKLMEEKKADLKEAIKAGIDRRRTTLHNQNDVAKIAAMLEEENISLPAQKENPLGNALELADFFNHLKKTVHNSSDKTSMDLALVALGASCSEVLGDNGGIADLAIVKSGKTIYASKIMDPTEHRNLINHWSGLVGKLPESELIAKKAAEQAKHESESLRKEISQHKHGMKRSW